ncbi:MAG: MerC domain-containing protein [Pseudomonadota bacterium]
MTGRTSDMAAMGLSGLCLLHCLALPMFISLSPIFGLASEEWVHGALAIAASAISLSVIAVGRPGRNRLSFVGLAIVGMALLLAAPFVEALHDYETPLTVAGASLLALAHAIRWRGHSEKTS